MQYGKPRTSISLFQDHISEDDAREAVKKRWVEQGIWKDEWDEMVAGYYGNIGMWKHEEPLEIEPEWETDTEAPLNLNLFGGLFNHTSRQPKSKDERHRTAEQRVMLDRERDASRPYYQFVIKHRKNENESRRIWPVRRLLMLLISTQWRTIGSKIPGSSGEFGMKDGADSPG